MTPEENAFQAALDENPDAHHVRLVFADFLQDHDDPRAEGYRCLGLRELRPVVHPNFAVWGGENHPAWNDLEWREKNRPWLLPTVWFRRFKFDRSSHDWEQDKKLIWKRHDNRREAEDAAVTIFAELPLATRLNLLAYSR